MPRRSLLSVDFSVIRILASDMVISIGKAFGRRVILGLGDGLRGCVQQVGSALRASEEEEGAT